MVLRCLSIALPLFHSRPAIQTLKLKERNYVSAIIQYIRYVLYESVITSHKYFRCHLRIVFVMHDLDVIFGCYIYINTTLHSMNNVELVAT